jgi:hypothetical protein
VKGGLFEALDAIPFLASIGHRCIKQKAKRPKTAVGMEPNARLSLELDQVSMELDTHPAVYLRGTASTQLSPPRPGMTYRGHERARYGATP